MKWQAFLASYKTSLVGIAVAALNLWAGGGTPKAIGISVGIALLGLVAKDADVTMSVAGTVAKPVAENIEAQKEESIEDKIREGKSDEL